MAGEVSRVPTSGSDNDKQWTVETALDHVLALLASVDLRYEQRFQASEKALDLGFSSQKSAIDAAFAAQKDAINAALASADRAVSKAELATEKRFESVNEFRGTLDQQQRTLIPRSEVAVIKDGIDEKISQLTKQIDELKSSRALQFHERQGIKEGWGLAAAAVGFVLLVLGVIAAVMTFTGRVQ